MHAVSYCGSGSVFSTVTNVMIGLALIQFCTIVFYHFLTYTCHCKSAIKLHIIKKRLVNLICRKRNGGYGNHIDIEMLDIPECAFNNSEYRDGLVSDDFHRED